MQNTKYIWRGEHVRVRGSMTAENRVWMRPDKGAQPDWCVLSNGPKYP